MFRRIERDRTKISSFFVFLIMAIIIFLPVLAMLRIPKDVHRF